MKFDIQVLTDSDEATRYTLYETWFNRKITIVLEQKIAHSWEVINSLSVPKAVLNVLQTDTKLMSLTKGLQGEESADKNFDHSTIYDRFQLPPEVRRVLFERDCEEIPMSENQMGYFSDLETLEWFWEIVQESSQRKEVSPPSPLKTPPQEDSTQEGEMLLEDEQEPQRMVEHPDDSTFICETSVTPTRKQSSDDALCPPAPKKSRIPRVNPSELETLDFSQF